MTEPTAEHLKAAQEWLRRHGLLDEEWSEQGEQRWRSLAALLASREQALRERLAVVEAGDRANIVMLQGNVEEIDNLKGEIVALREELDRYRMAPTAGGGFRFEWRDRALAAEARVRELQDEGIVENHAIMTLTGLPRDGYSLQQEIRAQLEEAQASVRELEAEVARAKGSDPD